jgi:hypothetical protein
MTTSVILGFMSGVIFVVVAWAIAEGRNAEHWNRE